MAIELNETGGEIVALTLLDGSTVRVKVDVWEADAAYAKIFREHCSDLPPREAGQPTTEDERAAYGAMMREWRRWLVGVGFPADLTLNTAADLLDLLRKKKEPGSDSPPSPASTGSGSAPKSRPKKPGPSRR